MAGIKLKQFMGILLNGNKNSQVKSVNISCCKFPKMKEDTPFRRAFKEYVREIKRIELIGLGILGVSRFPSFMK